MRAPLRPGESMSNGCLVKEFCNNKNNQLTNLKNPTFAFDLIINNEAKFTQKRVK